MRMMRTVRTVNAKPASSGPARGIAYGALIGIAVAGGLALPSMLPNAIASEEALPTIGEVAEVVGITQPPARIDGAALVKPDWTVEPWVSSEVTHEATVRKIGYGRTTFVSVMTTNTGTYSSDGLASPHIRYPGIHKNQTAAFDGIAVWDRGWKLIAALDAGSFVAVAPFNGGHLLMNEDGYCIRTPVALYC